MMYECARDCVVSGLMCSIGGTDEQHIRTQIQYLVPFVPIWIQEHNTTSQQTQIHET